MYVWRCVCSEKEDEEREGRPHTLDDEMKRPPLSPTAVESGDEDAFFPLQEVPNI